MKTLFLHLLVPVLGSAALVIACSSGTAPVGGLSGDQSQGNNGVTGGAGNGVNDLTGTGVAGGAGAGGGGGIKICPKDGQSTCSQSALASYNDCVGNACAAGYAQCFGAGYKSGSYSGPCGSYISCAQACACDDSACSKACAKKLDSACVTCVGQFEDCDNSCPKPECMTASSSSSSSSSGTTTVAKTCADLQACCRALSGSDQTSCNSLVTAANNNPSACNSYYAVLASQQKCH